MEIWNKLDIKILALSIFALGVGGNAMAQSVKNYAEGNCVQPSKDNGNGIWQNPCDAFDGELTTTTRQSKSWAFKSIT